MSTTPIVARDRATCGACEGSGTVLDIEGAPRPCSRCSGHLFDAWAKRRRPVPSPRPSPSTPDRVA